MVPIGSVTFDAPFFQAGLAGYSDSAMRLVARRHGCPYCVTEAMLDQFLISGGRGLRVAELDHGDHPIAGQLMGSHPREMAEAARILLRLGYDVIDIADMETGVSGKTYLSDHLPLWIDLEMEEQ